MPGLFPALRRLRARDFRFFILTNQSAVARGRSSFRELVDMHAFIRTKLEQEFCPVDGVYVAPTHPEGTVWPWDRVSCWRKPGAGMIEQAIIDHQLDPTRIVLVGDSKTDILAARAGSVGWVISFVEDSHESDLGADDSVSSWAELSDLILAKEW